MLILKQALKILLILGIFQTVVYLFSAYAQSSEESVSSTNESVSRDVKEEKESSEETTTEVVNNLEASELMDGLIHTVERTSPSEDKK